MECNREDASQAKEMAITKFNEQDFINAKKFAEKAQQLYPQLEGISGLLQNIELHIVAEKENGEINWYKVLDVSSTADVEIIKKQYKRRALTHHPDKNREVGSENAFKLVNEAFNILKDAQTRAEYDERVILSSINKPATNMDFEPNVPTYSEFVPDIVTPTHAAPPTREFNFFPTSSESSSMGDRTNDGPRNDGQTHPEYFNYIFRNKNVNIPSWFPPPPTYAQPSAYQPFSRPSTTFYEVPLQHQTSDKQQASSTSESKFSTPSTSEKKGSKKATPSTSKFSNASTSKAGSKKASASTSQFCNASTSKGGSSKKGLVKLDLKKLKKELFQIRSSTASCRGENTFWTECSGCKNKFEYMMIYMKQFIRCAICKEVFQAFEIDIPLCYSNEIKTLVASGTDSNGTTHYTFKTSEPVSQQRKAKGEGNPRSKKPKKSSENAAGVSLDEELMRKKKMAQADTNEELGQQRFGGGVRIKEEELGQQRFGGGVQIKEEPMIDEVEGQRFDGEVKEEPMSDTEMPFMPFL